jgi:hypothetical protein
MRLRKTNNQCGRIRTGCLVSNKAGGPGFIQDWV